MYMTYQEAMQYMEQIGKKGSILGLQAIRNLLNRLGNPQNSLPVIHVAGTNGKGSICTFLESMYRIEGRKVGRYISPTLYGYLERFQINGVWMEEDTFATLFEEIFPVLTEMEREGEALPTAFEVETAISFLYFLEEKVDLVILETGMGGREDATNVVDKPLCTVFASIGMDHMQFLGDTLEEIAYEKAGIIKTGCPVVSYPNGEAVSQVLKSQWEICNWNENPKPAFCVADACQVEIVEELLSGSRFLYKGKEYRISLSGTYQIYNAITAIETKLLLDGYLNKKSLALATWPGRFECMSEKPLFIRDGAHNIDGVMSLKRSLQKHFTNMHLIFIIGILKDKEYEKMTAVLCPMAEHIFTITPPGPRGLPAEVLRKACMPYCSDVKACERVEDASRRAMDMWWEYENSGEPAAIVAWGSLSYMGLIGRN